MVDFGGVKGTTPTMKRILLAAALSAGLATSAGAADSFTKSVVFTTSGYRGASALADFPVLVKLPGSVEGFDYADVGTGTNLLFKDARGFVLPHEIDTWDTNGTSLVWVRVPSVTAETTFTMYYDGASDAESAPSDVWTGAGYVGVWHMGEPDGAVADATGHGLAATPAPAGNESVSVRYAGTDAPVGHARTTGTETKGYLTVADDARLDVGSTFTMSGWVRMTDIQAGKVERLFSRKSAYADQNGWEIEISAGGYGNFAARGSHKDNGKSGGGEAGCSGTFAPTLQNRWTHVALVYDGSTLTVCSNGCELARGTISTVQDNDLNLSFGCNATGSEGGYFHGAFDECRLLDAVASADWIAAEYATVMDDSFVTASEVISEAPVLGAVAVAPAASSAAISGTILSLGLGNATHCDVYLAIGPSADELGKPKKIVSRATDSFSYRIPNLWARTTYFYELSVTNNARPAAGTSRTGSFTTLANLDFHKKIAFTVNYTNENEISVPVLVRLSKDSPRGFDPRHCAEGGRDLFFADANGDEIPCEIDTWDPSGDSLVWVRVPSVRRGTTFTMFYRGTPSSGGTASEVWSDYTGVWHLNDLGADDPTTWQSRGIYPNSTAVSGISAHLSTNSIPDEPGRFGKSFRVNDSSGWKQGNYNEGGAWVVDSGANSPLDANGVFTISGWFKHGNWNYNYGHLFFKRLNANSQGSPDGAFATQLGSNSWDNHVDAYGSSNGSAFPRVRATTDFSLKDVWVHLAFVYDNKSCTIYTNGAPANSYAYMAPATDNDAPLVFGNNVNIANGLSGDCAWSGLIDEVRYLKGAKSTEWIAAEYAAMADASFLTAGAAENIIKPTVIIVR